MMRKAARREGGGERRSERCRSFGRRARLGDGSSVCGVVPGVIGYGVMQITSTRNEQLEAQLRKNARPETTMMGQVNKGRLAEFLGELQRKEDTNDRYVAALKGETLTRKPYVRIPPVPKQNDAGVDKEQKK